jgi:hypothetical protein
MIAVSVFCFCIWKTRRKDRETKAITLFSSLKKENSENSFIFNSLRFPNKRCFWESIQASTFYCSAKNNT